jgi:hypothetical protein
LQKIQDGGWTEQNRLGHHLGIFGKHFFHKICVLLTPKECKKKIEKMLDTLRVSSQNLILIRHFG